MTMTLKPDFDRAYDHRSVFNLDASKSPEAVALRMLNAEEVYWEHYGWPEACALAICNIAGEGNYETAQKYAQWLYARLPKGADKMPCIKTLIEYAQGQFPYDDFWQWNTTVNLLMAREEVEA